MFIAKRLKKGDTIGIIVPSGPCTEEKYKEVLAFIKFIETLGLGVKIAGNFKKTDKFNTSGGTPVERATDFNDMVSNKDINAIWCLQGGDTINQIIELIDYDSLRNNPKIIIGKSDIDVLHNAIFSKIGLITFHGPDSKIGESGEMEIEYTQKWFQKRLFETENLIEASNPKDRYILASGKSNGTLIGCNLTSILKLAGTEYFPDFSNDFIFFIETYKDNPKGLLTKLEQFKMLGIFVKCRGVVIGSNFSFDDTYGKAEDIILDFVSEYNIPIIKTNEFGHYQPHAFLPIGAQVSIDTCNLNIKIENKFLK